MASRDTRRKKAEEKRQRPTMTRRKLSMKSFISGISVDESDDTLSSFLHGFKVFPSLSLSFSCFYSFLLSLALSCSPLLSLALSCSLLLSFALSCSPLLFLALSCSLSVSLSLSFDPFAGISPSFRSNGRMSFPRNLSRL